jgi:uridylate kinase
MLGGARPTFRVGDLRVSHPVFFLRPLDSRPLRIIQRQLRVMDSTALTLCMENKLPIYVFNMDDERNIDRIVCGERVGTVVST